MSKSTFVLVPLLLLVVAGLLIAGGLAVHRLGWTEGYAMGVGVAAGEASAVPYAPTGLSYVGLFLTAGLAFLLLMGVMSKLTGLVAFRVFAGPWMRAHRPPVGPGGPNSERWARDWHRYHRHSRPWFWCGQEQPDQPKEEVSGGSGPANS